MKQLVGGVGGDVQGAPAPAAQVRQPAHPGALCRLGGRRPNGAGLEAERAAAAAVALAPAHRAAAAAGSARARRLPPGGGCRCRSRGRPLARPPPRPRPPPPGAAAGQPAAACWCSSRSSAAQSWRRPPPLRPGLQDRRLAPAARVPGSCSCRRWRLQAGHSGPGSSRGHGGRGGACEASMAGALPGLGASLQLHSTAAGCRRVGSGGEATPGVPGALRTCERSSNWQSFCSRLTPAMRRAAGDEASTRGGETSRMAGTARAPGPSMSHVCGKTGQGRRGGEGAGQRSSLQGAGTCSMRSTARAVQGGPGRPSPAAPRTCRRRPRCTRATCAPAWTSMVLACHSASPARQETGMGRQGLGVRGGLTRKLRCGDASGPAAAAAAGRT